MSHEYELMLVQKFESGTKNFKRFILKIISIPITYLSNYLLNHFIPPAYAKIIIDQMKMGK